MTPSSVDKSAVVIVISINQSRPVREGRTTSPLSHPILTHRDFPDTSERLGGTVPSVACHHVLLDGGLPPTGETASM